MSSMEQVHHHQILPSQSMSLNSLSKASFQNLNNNNNNNIDTNNNTTHMNTCIKKQTNHQYLSSDNQLTLQRTIPHENTMYKQHYQQGMIYHPSFTNKVNNEIDKNMYSQLNDRGLSSPHTNGGPTQASNNNSSGAKQIHLREQFQQNNVIYNSTASSPTRLNQSPMMNQQGSTVSTNNLLHHLNSHPAINENNAPNGSVHVSHSPESHFINQGTFSPQKSSLQFKVDNFKAPHQLIYNPSTQNSPHLFPQQPQFNTQKNNQFSMGDLSSQVNVSHQCNSPPSLNVPKESLYQSFPTALHQYNFTIQSQQPKVTITPVVEIVSYLFKGFEFCLSGKFTLIQRKFETLILQHGGSVQKSINAVVTHLVSTQEELQQNEKAVKVTKAIARNIPIITEDFIQESIKHNKLQDVKKYVLSIPKDQKKEARAQTNQSVETQENDKKRKTIDDLLSSENEESKKQKQNDFHQLINKNQ